MSSTVEQTLPNKPVIVACPVSRCEVQHVAGIGVLLAIRYIEKAEQFETGERTVLQALVDPQQALEIGEALRRSVQVLEFGKSLRKALKEPKAEKKSTLLLPPLNLSESVTPGESTSK